eukprot:362836-Chlamydomonas_euryale.AAC.19
MLLGVAWPVGAASSSVSASRPPVTASASETDESDATFHLQRLTQRKQVVRRPVEGHTLTSNIRLQLPLACKGTQTGCQDFQPSISSIGKQNMGCLSAADHTAAVAAA